MVGPKVVGLAAGLSAWAILAFGLEAIAAQLGLQDILWPYVGLALWPIRVISVAGAVAAGWVCARWAGRRKRPARIALAALATLLTIVMALVGCFWFFCGTIDSDYRLISGAMLARWLPEPLELPRGAHRVHAVLTGGLGVYVRIRFEAPPEEAEQYVAAALRMTEEGRWHDYAVEVPRGKGQNRSRASWQPAGFAHNDWWTPEQEGRWWFKGSGSASLFLQRHSDGKTVFLMWSTD